MKTSLTEISLHPLTVLYIALSLLLGRFSFVFALFFIAFIHELFHVFAARIFKLKISEIQILPIGCYANIENIDTLKRFEQIIVLISGPLSFFFTMALITFFYRTDVISIYGYREYSEINFFMMIFNLLPIYPLDGGRILKIILSSILSEKKSITASAIIGLMVSLIFSLQLIKIGQYLFSSFILFYAIKNILNIKREYQSFLFKRYSNEQFKTYRIKINHKRLIYRYSYNFFVERNKIYSEDANWPIFLKK